MKNDKARGGSLQTFPSTNPNGGQKMKTEKTKKVPREGRIWSS